MSPDKKSSRVSKAAPAGSEEAGPRPPNGSAGRAQHAVSDEAETSLPDGPAAAAGFDNALREFFASPEESGQGDGVSLDAFRPEGEQPLSTDDVQEYLSFRLANENFALSILNIKEIIKPSLITPVPRTEAVILGILSLRGTVVPVLDLRLRLGLDVGPQDRRTRILIIQMDGDLIGLLVDEVRHVIRLHEEEIEPPPPVFGRVEVEHLLGVGRHDGEMFTLLNVNSVLQIDKLPKGRP